MKKRTKLWGLLLLSLICLAIVVPVPKVQAQAPAPDTFEENDSLNEAVTLSLSTELHDLSISPAADADWFRVLISPPPTYSGSYRVEVIGTPGLDLTLTIYAPDSSSVGTDNDPVSPNAVVNFQSSSEGWYAIEITDSSGVEGWYVLRLLDQTPAPTPTPTSTLVPTATGTLLPTATLPPATLTATPDLGGAPDYGEPNYDFKHAYRVVPGDTLTGLNFNAGYPGAIDNDFFVMAVRASIIYNCHTHDLGGGVDTNLIVYNSASTADVIGGNDDIDTQSGRINSRVTFTANKEGDVYLLVGYKYPEPNGLRWPGAATYTLTCAAEQPTPTPTSVPAVVNYGPPVATPMAIELLSQPENKPTPTGAPVIPQTIDVLVGYDRNNNGEVDPTEGVVGLSVRVIDTTTNTELSHGFTGESGTVRFTLVHNAPIRVVIPFLGAAEDFQPGSAVQWTILIPASNAPGLIP